MESVGSDTGQSKRIIKGRQFGASEKPRDDGFTEPPYPPAGKRPSSPRSAFQNGSLFGMFRKRHELMTQNPEYGLYVCHIYSSSMPPNIV